MDPTEYREGICEYPPPPVWLALEHNLTMYTHSNFRDTVFQASTASIKSEVIRVTPRVTPAYSDILILWMHAFVRKININL